MRLELSRKAQADLDDIRDFSVSDMDMIARSLVWTLSSKGFGDFSTIPGSARGGTNSSLACAALRSVSIASIIG